MVMVSIEELFDLAAERKGGSEAFSATLATPLTPAQLAKIPNDRWLSAMSKCVFNAGFNWRVVDTKWPSFEDVFEGFNPNRLSMMSDEDLDRYLKDARIIRHGKKISAIAENARFCLELSQEAGSVGKAIGGWSSTDFIGLLQMLKKRGTRIGGATGQYFLRSIGVDSFILSKDVVRALIRDGVVEKSPTSKRDLAAVQDAFNHWMDTSPYSLSQISRILACPIE